MHRLLKLFLAVPLVAVLLAGCSLLPEKIDETRGWSAQRLYSEAKESMNGGNYKTALEYLDKLQARYPFGRLAHRPNWIRFTSSIKTTSQMLLLLPPTASLRPIHAIRMWIMLIT